MPAASWASSEYTLGRLFNIRNFTLYSFRFQREHTLDSNVNIHLTITYGPQSVGHELRSSLMSYSFAKIYSLFKTVWICLHACKVLPFRLTNFSHVICQDTPSSVIYFIVHSNTNYTNLIERIARPITDGATKCWNKSIQHPPHLYVAFVNVLNAYNSTQGPWRWSYHTEQRCNCVYNQY